MMRLLFTCVIFIAAFLLEVLFVPRAVGFFLPFTLWAGILAALELSLSPALIFVGVAWLILTGAYPVFGVFRFAALAGSVCVVLLLKRVLREEPISYPVALASGIIFGFVAEPAAVWVFMPNMAGGFFLRDAFAGGIFFCVASTAWFFIFMRRKSAHTGTFH